MDWKCEVQGCGQDFESVIIYYLFIASLADLVIVVHKKTMTAHNPITHLVRRDHFCPLEDCNSVFGYNHLLQRHVAKVHSTHTRESDLAESTDVESNDEVTEGNVKAVQRMVTDTITGMSYATHANERLSTSKALTFISAISYPFLRAWALSPSRAQHITIGYRFRLFLALPLWSILRKGDMRSSYD